MPALRRFSLHLFGIGFVLLAFAFFGFGWAALDMAFLQREPAALAVAWVSMLLAGGCLCGCFWLASKLDKGADQ